MRNLALATLIIFVLALFGCGQNGITSPSIDLGGNNGGSVDTGGNGNNGGNNNNGNNSGNTNPPPVTTPTWQSTLAMSKIAKDTNGYYGAGIEGSSVTVAKFDSNGTLQGNKFYIYSAANCRVLDLTYQTVEDFLSVIILQQDPVNPSGNGNIIHAKVNKNTGVVSTNVISGSNYNSQFRGVVRLPGENSSVILFANDNGTYVLANMDLDGLLSNLTYPDFNARFLAVTATNVFVGGTKSINGYKDRVYLRTMNRNFSNPIDMKYDPNPSDVSSDNCYGIVANASGVFLSASVGIGVGQHCFILKANVSNNTFTETYRLTGGFSLSQLTADANGNIYGMLDGDTWKLLRFDANGVYQATAPSLIQHGITQIFPDLETDYVHVLHGQYGHAIYDTNLTTRVF